MTDTDFDVDWRQVEHTGELVRSYGADGQIYAIKEGHEHLIESQGNEPATRWKKRVPAERQRVVPGQQLWTIPSNWEFKVRSRRDNIAYGIYYIPESDTYVKVSIPTNDRLIDAWYGVKAVGDLELSTVGELASKDDVYRLANEFKRDEPELYEALRQVAHNWDVVEKEFEIGLEYVEDEARWDNNHDQPVSVGDDWKIVFDQYIVHIRECLEEVIDTLQFSFDFSHLTSEIDHAGLLPKEDRVKIGIDDSSTGMESHMRALIEAGCTPPEALDYYYVEIDGVSQNWWATQRGVDNSTVSRNVTKARRKIK